MTKEAEIGPAGGAPDQPTGSFTGAKALDQIQRQRTADAVERGKAGGESDEEKDEEQTKKEKEIDALLPDKINCVLGEVPFATFKEMYKEIWDQVESKEHLAKGFCTHTREIAAKLPVTFRTLRANETSAVNRFAPDPGTKFGDYMATDSEYRKIQLAIGIKEFDGKENPPLEIPRGDLKEWEKSQGVIERFNWIDGLPEELVAVMSAILADVTIAYRMALRENLKNQLAPH